MKKPSLISILYFSSGLCLVGGIIFTFYLYAPSSLPPIHAITKQVDSPQITDTPQKIDDNESSPETLSKYIDSLVSKKDFTKLKDAGNKLLQSSNNDPKYILQAFWAITLSTTKNSELKTILDDFKTLTNGDFGTKEEGQYLSCLINSYEMQKDQVLKICGALLNSKNEGIQIVAKKLVDQTKVFSTFQDESPDYLTAMYAKTFVDAKFYTLAKFKLEYLIQKNTKYRDAVGLLGITYYLLGDLIKSRDTLEQAYALDTSKPHIVYTLGKIQDELGDKTQAISYYYLALQNGYPEKSEIRTRLASLLYQEKEITKSLKEYNTLLDDLPIAPPEAFIQPVYIYIKIQNDPLGAVAYAKRVRALYPDNALSINMLGWSYLENHQLDTAKTLFKLAITKKANYNAPYFNLGQLYELQNEKEKAKEMYKRSYQLDKSSEIGKQAIDRYNALNQ